MGFMKPYFDVVMIEDVSFRHHLISIFHTEVNVPNCERHDCSSVNADIAATSLLFDPTLSAHYGLKNAPLYVCDACMVCCTL